MGKKNSLIESLILFLGIPNNILWVEKTNPLCTLHPARKVKKGFSFKYQECFIQIRWLHLHRHINTHGTITVPNKYNNFNRYDIIKILTTTFKL